MKAYHYAVVHGRDAGTREARNIGLLVVAPGERAWVRRADLKSRTHLVGDSAQFVRALLDQVQDEATEVARSGGAEVVYDWLRRRSTPTEDTVFLGAPAVGITGDLKEEISRLALRYLGKPPTPRRSSAERASVEALRLTSLRDRFVPMKIPVGPASWGFPHVAETLRGPLIVQPLHFGQKSPEGVLDAAFTNVGRFGEVRRAHPHAELLAVSGGPSEGDLGLAFRMAKDRMADGGIRVVDPEVAAIAAALRACIDAEAASA